MHCRKFFCTNPRGSGQHDKYGVTQRAFRVSPHVGYCEPCSGYIDTEMMPSDMNKYRCPCCGERLRKRSRGTRVDGQVKRRQILQDYVKKNNK